MARGVGGEGGAVGGRDPQAGGQRDVDRARDGGRDRGRAIDNPRVRGAGGYMSPTGRLAQRADVQAATRGRATDAQADAAARAWADRISDYRNTYNSPTENFGNFVAGLLGFNERVPSFDPSLRNTQTRADWGWDPAGFLGGMVDRAFGLPIGPFGFIADRISAGLNRPLEIGLGPDVFGGGTQIGQTASYGGRPQFAGGGNGNFGWQPQNYGRPPSYDRPKVTQPSIPQQNQWGPAPTPQPPNLWAPQMPGLDNDSFGLLGQKPNFGWRP